jgi:hypothetical protein
MENLENNADFNTAVNDVNVVDDGFINSGAEILGTNEPEAVVEEVQAPIIEDEVVEPVIEEPKPQNGIEKRFAKLTAQRNEERNRVAALEAKLHAFENKQPERDRDDYSDDEWMSKLAEEKANELFNNHLTKQREAEQAQHAANTQKEQWQTKIQSFDEEMPDFKEVVSQANIEMPMDVLQSISQSDIGPKIAYHLAKNPEQAESLQFMDERGRDRFLMKLEIKLEDTSFKPVPKVEVTKATPTPKSNGKPNGSVNMNAMSMDDWMAARNKQVHGR